MVKTICEGAFDRCTNLFKIEFNRNSELHIIDHGAFKYTNIEHLNIPASIKDLKSGWCTQLNKLRSISISPENKYFSVFEGKMIVGKSNPNDDVYDILHYVTHNVLEITIPQFIKKIDDYALNNCSRLQTVEFSNR